MIKKRAREGPSSPRHSNAESKKTGTEECKIPSQLLSVQADTAPLQCRRYPQATPVLVRGAARGKDALSGQAEHTQGRAGCPQGFSTLWGLEIQSLGGMQREGNTSCTTGVMGGTWLRSIPKRS